MDADEYQAKTEETQLYTIAAKEFINARSGQQLEWLEIAYCTGKLNGEAGEIAEIVFKAFRGTQGIIPAEKADELVKELGDALWYIARISDLLGFKLSEIMEINIAKLQDRQARNVIHGYGDER